MFPQFDDVAVILVPKNMRSKIDYCKEVGVPRATNIIEEKKKNATTNEKKCWLFSGSLNTDEYGQVYIKPNSKNSLKGRSAQKAFLIHILSYLSRNETIDTRLHISHLCRVRSCFNPEHLFAEPAIQNNARKGCIGNINCPDCNAIAYSCPHIPKCI